MIQYKRELITPEIAKKILEKNKNRNLLCLEKNISLLTQLMISGEFKNDLSTIFIDTDGYLIDGQSRLTAIIRSNKSYYFMIARNTPSDYQLHIDTNRKSRSAADTLQLHTNTTNYALIAGMISRLIKLESKISPSDDGKISIKYTNDRILEYYKNHTAELEESAKIAHRIYTQCKKIMAPSLIGAYLVYFNRNISESGTKLMEEILIFSEKKFCDSIKDRIMVGVRDSRKKMTIVELNQFVFKAYNAILNNKSYKSLRYEPTWIPYINNPKK